MRLPAEHQLSYLPPMAACLPEVLEQAATEMVHGMTPTPPVKRRTAPPSRRWGLSEAEDAVLRYKKCCLRRGVQPNVKILQRMANKASEDLLTLVLQGEADESVLAGLNITIEF